MSPTRIPISPPPFCSSPMSLEQAQAQLQATPGTVILGTLTPSALKRRSTPKYQIYAGVPPPVYDQEMHHSMQPMVFEGFPPLPTPPQEFELESRTRTPRPASVQPGLLTPQYGVENVAFEISLAKAKQIPSPRLHNRARDSISVMKHRSQKEKLKAFEFPQKKTSPRKRVSFLLPADSVEAEDECKSPGSHVGSPPVSAVRYEEHFEVEFRQSGILNAP